MVDRKHTPEGAALSDTILDLFRLTSLLQTAGDRLVAHLGLTSARWQVLGAIVAAERPEPVAWLARDMGANRQNVQRIVNDMHGEGLVAFEENPHHRRAQLIVLTPKGQQAYDAAMRLEAPWMNGLAEAQSPRYLQTLHQVIVALREKLEREESDGAVAKHEVDAPARPARSKRS